METEKWTGEPAAFGRDSHLQPAGMLWIANAKNPFLKQKENVCSGSKHASSPPVLILCTS